MKYNKLTEKESNILLKKGTEPPFTGEFINNKTEGYYLCKQCNKKLYRSSDKFESNCGWVSFDDQLEGAIEEKPDNDGRRTEIVCAECGGHMGHVFKGEGYTPKNTRHCVNSLSLNFEPSDTMAVTKKGIAYFASGCFWGTEFFFSKAKGVYNTTTGYMGGTLEHPSYEEVCTGDTGHVETVKIEYSTSITNFEDLVKLFFETHDFTQTDGQGPDKGSQYLSVIFFTNKEQRDIAEMYITILESKGFTVATKVLPASTFWEAEGYHQMYYSARGGRPYCHAYRKIF